ncbi:TetR family transcriptional regulator [Paenarthrobacter ilicis]|uniref:TetR/AcrR family transcriptional regulator n=1 Tax=Paenarthrobacter ilicis TaxID=43665 RepID=UPI0028D743E8|nr:TetR family transcriptional regulator [Paenarthrobacter ilicis]
MPRLKDSTKLARREQIAEAALRRFSRDGFANTSMADIIAESGLSAGSIYSHFASKAELVQFVAATVLDSRFAALAGSPGGQRRVVRPSEILEAFSSAIDRERAQLLLQVWAEIPRNDEMADLAEAQVNRLRELLRAALEPWESTNRTGGNAHLAEWFADVVLASIQGLIVRVAIDPAINRTALLNELGKSLDHTAAPGD